MSPYFKYTAEDSKGRYIVEHGRADAPIEIAKKLRKKGYHMRSIKEIDGLSSDNTESKKIFNKKNVKLNDLLIFSEQFSVMLRSGIPIIEALTIIGEQIENKKFADIIVKLKQDVEKGSSLSETMALYPKVFPYFYCQMVRVGEKAGILDDILSDLTEYYRWQSNITKKIKSSLYYPLLVLITAFLAIIMLLIKVIPSFVEIFSSFNAGLPLPTRIVIFVSQFIQNYYLYFLGSIVILIIIAKYYLRKEKGREKFDNLSLSIPYFGKIKKLLIIWRFSKMMSLLIKNGISLLDSLDMMEDIVSNKVVKSLINNVQIEVREGAEFSKALNRTNFFPLIMIKMTKTGEKAGLLDEMLGEAANYLKDQLERRIKNLVTLIEPVLIIGLAFIVGFIAVSVILPMFNMYSLF